MPLSFSRKRRLYFLARRRYYFLHSQWAGGVVLLICSAVALLLANLDFTKDFYSSFWHREFIVGMEGFAIRATLEDWINDALMAVFFFVVGLEIKREVIAGQLSSIRQAGLPIAAAVGGMLLPALIYSIFNYGTPYESGWGIPMATDIAFALGVLSLLGKKVPLSLKIFLTALAIVDDLGAIVVIALFYSSQIDWVMILAVLITLAVLFTMNRMRIYGLRYYVVLGILLWIFFLHSGIHATIAGVLIAMTVPTTARFSKSYFLHKANSVYKHIYYFDGPNKEILANEQQHEYLEELRRIARNSISPTQRLEYSLNGLVTFFIMPVFALANAGVEVNIASFGALFTSETVGIFTGLVIGKPVGIFLFSWITVKLGWCVLPKFVTWGQFFAVCCLGGIGFTMSIFITNLAFTDPAMISSGKIAIILASLTASLLGWAMIRLTSQYPLKAKKIN